MDVHALLRRVRAGHKNRAIARAMHISRNSVIKYRNWFEAEGLVTGPLPDLAELHQRLQATFGSGRLEGPATWYRPGSGALNDNFVLDLGAERYFVKIYRPGYSLELVRLEHQVLLTLNANGQPVPMPLRAPSGQTWKICEGRLVTISSFIEGSVLSQNPLDSRLAGMLGRTIAGIHQALSRLSGKLIERAPRMNLDAQQASDRLLRVEAAILELPRKTELDDFCLSLVHEYSRLLDQRSSLLAEIAKLPHQLTHGDLHGGNVLIAGSPESHVSGIVDWEGIGVRPRVLDLAKFLVLAIVDIGGRMNDLRYVLPFIGACQEVEKLTHDELAVLPMIYPIFIAANPWLFERRYFRLDSHLDRFITLEHHTCQWLQGNEHRLRDILEAL